MDIIPGQARKISEDLLLAHPAGQVLEHFIDGNAGTRDTRFTASDVRNHGEAISERHDRILSDLKGFGASYCRKRMPVIVWGRILRADLVVRGHEVSTKTITIRYETRYGSTGLEPENDPNHNWLVVREFRPYS
jgi:hypothetical protein